MTVYAQSFLPYVLDEAPGCPDIVAENHIRNAVIRFCDESTLWRHKMPAIGVEKDVTEYAMDAPAETRIVMLTAAKNTDKDLVVGRDVYLSEDKEAFTLTEKPQETKSAYLTLTVAIKPERAAIEFEDFLFEDWMEVIASGAKATLLAMPGKPWSNGNLAVYHRGLFKAGVDKARARAEKRQTNASLAVSMREFI